MNGSERLYWAAIEEARGRIFLKDSPEPIETNFQGDMLIVGHSEGGLLLVHEIRRFSKASEAIEEIVQPLGGIISMSGPVEGPIRLESPAPDGEVSFTLHAYYPELRTREGSRYTDADTHARIPPLKTIICEALTWRPGELPDSLIVNLRFSFPEDETEGEFERTDFEKEDVSLNFQAISETDEDLHELKTLRVNFVILAKSTLFEQQQAMIDRWLAGVNEVWTVKGGLAIVDEVIDFQKLDHSDFVDFDSSEPANFFIESAGGYQDISLIGRHPAVNAVTVYLIDHFKGNRHGGGISFAIGTDNAYVILDVDLAKILDANNEFNTYLLAHELGHVLGLLHPKEVNNNFRTGSPCSIMVTRNPNWDRNPHNNLAVLEETRFPMSKVLTSQLVYGPWQPDDEITEC